MYTSVLPLVHTDSTSTMQGVDHRHIQRELADVVIHLRTPTVLSSSAVRVQWTVRGSRLGRRFCATYRAVT